MAVLACWILGTAAGTVPVLSGVFTTVPACTLQVHKGLYLAAGLVSFWIPATIMLYVYTRCVLAAKYYTAGCPAECTRRRCGWSGTRWVGSPPWTPQTRTFSRSPSPQVIHLTRYRWLILSL